MVYKNTRFADRLYIMLGPIAALWLGAWLWFLMRVISLHLFWLSKHFLPSARAELRQEALLSLVIPFHAMRAAELASVHAFATTHPAAMLLAHGQADHPWLGKFVRSLLLPRLTNPGDAALAAVALPPLEKALGRSGLSTSRFLGAPDRSDDPKPPHGAPAATASLSAVSAHAPIAGDLSEEFHFGALIT